MPLGVEAKSSGYGSGRIYAKRQTLAQSSNLSIQDDNCTDNDFLYNNTSYSGIWMKEDARMTSGPIAMEPGKGYFADHPPTFQLPLTDETWIINSDDGSSMHHEVTYSHALDAELEASIEDYQSEDDDQALNTMKVAENVTAGMTHIGIVQLDIDDDGGDDDDDSDDDDSVDGDEDGDLALEMDETYAGTFQIVLNATLPDDDEDDDDDDEDDDSDDDDDEDDDYLPCCNGQSQKAASQGDSGCSQGGPLSGDNVTQELSRIVQGVGYFTAYRYLATPDDLEIEGSGHGSGAIESEWQFTGQSDDDNCSLIACLNNNSPDCIQRDQSQMNFSPVIMAVGEGFYADHPVTYESLIWDATSIKDSINDNSMHHEVGYAHGLCKELGITIYDIDDDDDDNDESSESDEEKEYYNQGCNATAEPTDSDEVTTIMNLSQKVIEGKAHTAFSLIGGCAGDEDGGEGETEGICAAVQVDEVYVGTFRIVQNMTLTTPDADEDDDDDGEDDVAERWLPRCNCGYWDANLYDYGGWRQDCIFDCNCTGLGEDLPK